MEEYNESVTTREQLSSRIGLKPGEGIPVPSSPPLRISPLLMRCVEKEAGGPDFPKPLRTQFVPSPEEARVLPYESPDPLFEAEFSPLPRLIHRYPDRVLITVTDECAAYCRYCFRRHLTGAGVPGAAPKGAIGVAEMNAIIGYIRKDSAVREIILSGGDPLTLPDDSLREILRPISDLRTERDRPMVVRIASRIPTVLPSRITGELTGLLRSHAPIWLVLQCNHPAELTSEAREALSLLSVSGIPMLSQTVLLRGVNDDPRILAELFHSLSACSVKPYYLFQGDLSRGTSRFRLPLSRSFEIVASLRSLVSGLAMPRFAVDLPGGGGKKVLHEEMPLLKKGSDYIFTGPDGREYRYPDETLVSLDIS